MPFRRALLRVVAGGLAAGLLLGGCGLPDREGLRSEPDERLTREAYLDTPLIEDGQAREIEPRTQRSEVFERLGRSHVGYPRGEATCYLYPIRGTERRDAFGSPAADEWELCFEASGELVARRRIPSR